VVALEIETGELDWYQQATPHDLYDHDLANTLLVDVGQGATARRVPGRERKGRFRHRSRRRHRRGAVDDAGGRPRERPDDRALGPTMVLPGGFGGVLTPPAAADGVVYVAVINAPSVYVPDNPNSIGGLFGTMDGQAVAIDAANGQILWDVPVPGDPFGGMTVVNDLVFTATFQAKVLAFDRATGALVWTWDAPGGINGWPAVADDVMLWPVGFADPARLVALRLPR
jgi:glucose dehydrogenase